MTNQGTGGVTVFDRAVDDLISALASAEQSLSKRDDRAIADVIESVSVSAVLELGTIELTVGELMTLSAGTVIDLAVPEAPVSVVVCGSVFATGTIVSHEGSVAVRIDGVEQETGAACGR